MTTRTKLLAALTVCIPLASCDSYPIIGGEKQATDSTCAARIDLFRNGAITLPEVPNACRDQLTADELKQ